MTQKNNPANGIKIPWYGYLMIFMVYATPFIMMTPIALLTGFFSNEEFAIIFGNPLLNILTGVFNYDTNILSVTFDKKVESDILISYDYESNLNIDTDHPLNINYKVSKVIQVNEIGIEDENHELLAYMTFPNIEPHTIYDNISCLFSIDKS